jgi:large repetitive protein
MQSIRKSRQASVAVRRSIESAYRAEALECRRLLAAITSGETQSGTLGVVGEQDDYTFTAAAGETAIIATAESTVGSTLSLRIQLLSPSNAILFNTFGSVAAGGTVTNLPAAGTYTIRVLDTGTATGNYLVSLAKLGGTHVDGGDDGAISSGEYISSTTTAADIDIYTINANAGGSLSISAGELSSQSLLMQVAIYSPTGAQLYNSANDTQAATLVNLPASGTYHVVIYDSGFNDVGTYNATVVVAPSTQTVDADSGSLVSGVRRTGSIAAGDADVYTVVAPVNGSIVFSIAEANAPSAAFGPRVEIFSPTGARVFSTAAATGTADTLTSTVSGTYVFVIQDSGGDAVGDYALTAVVSGASQPTDPDSGAVASGSTRLGTIDAGDLDVYTFSATAGGTVYFAAADTVLDGFDIGVLIIGPNGSVLTSGAGATTTSNTLANLAATGTYTAVIYDQFGDETGSYRFNTVYVPGTQTVDADSKPIVSGVRNLGTTDLADFDVYTLTASVNSSILVTFAETVSSATYGAQMALLSPTGVILQNVTTGTGNAFLQTATVAGTYTLVIWDSFVDSAGEYAFTATVAPSAVVADTDSGPASSGVTYNGFLDAGDTDLYTISGTAGSALLVNLADPAAGAISPQLIIFGPAGAVIYNASDVTANVASLTNLSASGTYTIAVLDNFSDNIGSYVLTALSVGAAAQPNTGDSGPLSSNVQRTGSLPLGDIDVFTVDMLAGASLLYAVAETTTSSANVQVLTYTPAGVVVSNLANAVGLSALVQNAVAGRYTIAVIEQFGNEAVDYTGTFVFVPGTQTLDGDSSPVVSAEYRRGDFEPGDIDVFTIALNAGNDLLVTATESNYLGGANVAEVGLIIFSPTGAVLENTANPVGRAVRIANVPAAGTYTIAVFDSNSDETGVYGLTATNLDNTPALTGDSGPIGSGVTKRGRIDYGDTDVHEFTAVANQSVVFWLSDINRDLFTPAVYLVAPDGSLLVTDANASAASGLSANLTQAGTYRIVVWNSTGVEVGDYAMTMVLSNSTQPTTGDSGTISLNQIRTGTITSGDADVYTYSATAGVNFTVNLVETQASGFDPGIYIFRPNGTLFSNSSGATSATLTASSVVAGNYTIVIHDVSGDETGSYSVAIGTAAGSDVEPPTFYEAEYRFNDVSPSIVLYATEDIATTFLAEDLQLTNLTTSQTIPAAALIVTYDATTNRIGVSPGALPGGVFADGNYRLRIAAGAVGDASGNNLAATYDFNFHVLAGDVDYDTDIDFTDLLTLVQNYGKIGRSFSQGNIDYDTNGTISFADLLLQVQSYGTDLTRQDTPSRERATFFSDEPVL